MYFDSHFLSNHFYLKIQTDFLKVFSGPKALVIGRHQGGALPERNQTSSRGMSRRRQVPMRPPHRRGTKRGLAACASSAPPNDHHPATIHVHRWFCPSLVFFFGKSGSKLQIEASRAHLGRLVHVHSGDFRPVRRALIMNATLPVR